ncbi:MAG: hypothetical protein ACTSUE_18000 [Promethearchaeota archaeon]
MMGDIPVLVFYACENLYLYGRRTTGKFIFLGPNQLYGVKIPMKGAKICVISSQPVNMHNFIETFASQLKTIPINGGTNTFIYNLTPISTNSADSVTFLCEPDPSMVPQINSNRNSRLEDFELKMTFNFILKPGKGKMVVKLFISIKGPKIIERLFAFTRWLMNRMFANRIKNQVFDLCQGILVNHVPESRAERPYSRSLNESLKQTFTTREDDSRWNRRSPRSPEKKDPSANICPYCGYKLHHAREGMCPKCKVVF